MAQPSNKNPKQTSFRIWSLNSTYSACTLHEVAYMLGLTRESVRQIEAKALAKIRRCLREQGLAASELLRSESLNYFSLARLLSFEFPINR